MTLLETKLVASPTPVTDAPGDHARRIAPIAIAHTIHDTYTGFLPPLLPIFIETLGITRAGAGLLTVFLRMPSLFQPLIGHLAERTGLRYLLILTPALTTIMMSLLGIAPTYVVLALFLLAAGISSAALHTVGPVLVGDLSEKRLGRGLSYWMVGGELGRVLGPLVIAGSLGILGLQGMPWLMLGGLLTSAWLYIRLRHLTNSTISRPQPQPWGKALRHMGPYMMLMGVFVILRGFATEALGTYLPLFLTEQGSSLWLAGLSLAVFEATGMVGTFFGGALSDRLGRQSILLLGVGSTSALMLIFLAVEGWLLFPLLLLLGFTALSTTPVLMALIQERFPNNRALANGFYMALSFVLRSLVTLLLGWIGDQAGMRNAYLVSAVVPLLGLPLIFTLTRERT